LGQARSEIFLQMGLDRKCCVICSSGKIGLILLIPPPQPSFRGAQSASPESTITTGSMDSGQPLRGFRNDELGCSSTTTTSEQADTSSVVIPGCAAWRRPGIHNHNPGSMDSGQPFRGFRNDELGYSSTTTTSEQADASSVVVPGRAKREPRCAIAHPGIHNHNREYGFRTAAARLPE
jgi:hypothetical protein